MTVSVVVISHNEGRWLGATVGGRRHVVDSDDDVAALAAFDAAIGVVNPLR
jgi:hypothetical protein